MSWSPWSQGDLRELWIFSLEPDGGTFDITGVATTDFTFHMTNLSNGTERVGTGVFSSLVAASGGNPATITYDQSVADVGTPGIFDTNVICAPGGEAQTFSFGLLSIEPN